MSPSRRGVALTSMIAVSALALSACGGGSDDTKPDTLGEGTSAAAEGDLNPDAIIEAGISYGLSGGFDPMTTTGAVTVAANWHTLEGVTELDPVTREVMPAIGAELPEQIDETTWQITLRDGAVFHNGDPVTTEDVVFSFERVLDPANESLYAGFLTFLDSVEAVDDTTVEFTTKFPFSLVAERLSVVKVLPQDVVESDYEGFNSLPIGTGPYKITEATPDDKITFERFDDYSGPRPALAAGMNWNLLSDSAARVTALSSGTTQAIESVPYIDIAGLENQVDVESVQSFGLLFMMFNTEKAPFDDVNVRQAFFYALDMDKIIDTGLLGNAAAAKGFLPETHPNYNEASTVYSYDPEKAKSMLADAGVEDLSINLKLTDTDWVADIAPLIKEDLEAVGISTSLDIGQSGGQYAAVDGGDLDVMIAPGDPSVFGNDPDLLMRWWFGDNVWAQDRYRWSESDEFAELHKVLDSAVEKTDDAQQEDWNQAFDMLSEEVPLYPLLHRQLPTAWNSDELSGFKPISLTGLSFLDVGVLK